MDLLHEFELGVFKSVFRHLLRLLHAINPVLGMNLVAILDARYVLLTCYGVSYSTRQLMFLCARFYQIPSFGKGAIRRFPSNVSEARQCAARHFEDVLQVGISVRDWYALLGLS